MSASSESQLTDLYAEHHGWLITWVRRKLSDTHLAADLTQDTFVKVLTSREVLSIREPRTFLATIARGLIANHFRRQDVERAYLEALVCLPESYAMSPEDRAVILEALCEIDQMLNGLPVKVRKAFLLSQLEGMTYADIAKELEVSLSMVKQYMLKATQHCYFNGSL